MYDPQLVLAAIDANRWGVLGLCGFAMICNYAWFIAAVRKGYRDAVYPIPLLCTVFWFAGDSSMVLRFDLWFNVIDHWYVKLFWAALVLTTGCEIIFLWMTWRFGAAELAPRWSRAQFGFLLGGMVIVTYVLWEFVKRLLGDPLYIDYFHIANFVGPPLAIGLSLRRGTRAGTSTFIWVAYTLMAASWFLACALWFGEPFAAPRYMVLYLVCVLVSAIAVWVVKTLPEAQAAGQTSGR